MRNTAGGGIVNSVLPALAVNENDIDNLEADDEADETGEVSVTIEDSEVSEAGEEIYCEHHTEHTEECGYVEAVEGQPCTHEHDENCGYAEAVKGQDCIHEHDVECGYVEGHDCTNSHDEECSYVEGHDCTHEHDENCETTGCTHEHDNECGYVEGHDCNHSHNENCGYAEEQPCTHEHGEECGNSEATGCTHEHDENCGYVEAVEGQPCQFVCEICESGSEELLEEDSEQGVNTMAVEPMAASNEKGLVAQFTFNQSGRLSNSASGGVTAELWSVNAGDAALGGKIERTSWENYFDGTDDNADALHLQNDACLVLRNVKALKGLNELTFEMRVNISDAQAQHWLFYAIPDGDNVTDSNNCLGAGILGNNKQLRAIRNNNSPKVDYNTGVVLELNSWHTIRVVYKVSTMALYIDGERVAESGAGGKTADYFTDSTAIWLGHSAFPDTNFNGYIDDVKIYNYAKDDYPIDEQKYIITKDLQDPPSTIVNMFDYWITGQKDNDYNPPLSESDLINSGINKNHLFLFAGSDSAQDSYPNQDDRIGAWNNYFSSTKNKYEPYRRIVAKLLGSDGYPHLALDQLDINIPEALMGRSRTESMAYLFKPSNTGSKAAYPNVTGLFRLDDQGYYYFDSALAYAELNTGESNRPKKSKSKNHITLYNKIWDPDNAGTLGQFFPLNDWSDLFYQPVGGGDPVQANNMGVQATTDEPMNHYLGMTVTTKFRQPADGIIPSDSEDEEGEKMQFTFSGDDDVWVFIDDVLVGDLGGLHMRVRFNIDFSTGIIESLGDLGATDGGPHALQTVNDDLYDAYVKAGKADKFKWKDVTVDDVTHKVFADDSAHTLKFFYLERGNAASNCSIRFNLYQPKNVSAKKPSKPSGEDEPENIPAEENQPVNISAQQPPEEKTAGVLASPNTGDSGMVTVWIILLVSSIMGIVALYRTRKRGSKQQ